MTTQEIANRLVELCRAGEYDTCYAELFSPDIVTVWPKWSPEETPTVWMEALQEKWKKWHEMMEKFIAWWVSDPLVAGDFFTLTMWFECVYKGKTESSKEEEVVVYEVSNGKIVKERYFYGVK